MKFFSEKRLAFEDKTKMGQQVLVKKLKTFPS